MSMYDAVLSVLRQYATFSGRARRSEYWWFSLAYAIVWCAAGVVDVALGTADTFGDGGLLSGLLALALFLPGLAVGARRLHDTGRSGWRQLVVLIPILGVILLLIWLTRDSKPGNQYGPNPKVPTSSYPFDVHVYSPH